MEGCPRTLESALRTAWCRWTCDPVDQPRWSESNPSWGQCASTALVIQDRLSGDLLLADVHEADGTPAGVHFWNRLPDGAELDLTSEQFRDGQVVGSPREVARPADVTRGRLPGQYHLLSGRVQRALSDAGSAGTSWPVTTKAVCVHHDGRILMCRNHRGEWELPGGRPDVGELFHDCVVREVREETGLEVVVDRLLGVAALEAVPGRWVDVVAYSCAAPSGDDLQALNASPEHTAVAFLDPSVLSDAQLPSTYQRFIAEAATSAGE
jgi:ADP-ribose pyrophosphatase YjhB (NUDIX family)